MSHRGGGGEEEEEEKEEEEEEEKGAFVHVFMQFSLRRKG